MGSIILGSEYFNFPHLGSYDDSCDAEASRVVAALKAAQPGDLLLIRTPRIGFELGRRAARNPYDHIAVVLDGEKTLNIVTPKAIILPITVFAKPEKRPLVLRPKWKSPEQRDTFVEEMKGFDRCPYDLRKTLIGVVTSVLYARLGLRIPMKKPKGDEKRWICTEAILTSIVKACPDFERIDHLKLDYNRIGFATTNDFFRICRHCPEILEVITT